MLDSYIATLPIVAFSIGVQISSIYTSTLDYALTGELPAVCVYFLYFIMCLMNPVFGYLPNIREYSEIIVVGELMFVYIFPQYSIVGLGALLAMDSLYAFLADLEESEITPTRILGVSGFLVGRNPLVRSYSNFLILIGPMVLMYNGLNRRSSGGSKPPPYSIDSHSNYDSLNMPGKCSGGVQEGDPKKTSKRRKRK